MKRILIISLLILCIPYLSTADILLFEDFEHGGAPPSGWSLITPDPTNWTFSTNSSRYGGGVTTGSGDYAAVVDSDLDGGTVDAWLITPSINCANYTNIIVEFHHRYVHANETGDEGIYIYIADDGVLDTNDNIVLYEGSISILPTTTNIDISSVANKKSDIKLGFRYKASYDWFWIVDDVSITGTLAWSSSPTQKSQEITPSDFIAEQVGEKDIIIGRNKIHTSKY